MLAYFSGHNPGLVSMVKATMKRWWTWVWAVVAGGLFGNHTVADVGGLTALGGLGRERLDQQLPEQDAG